MAYAYLKVAHKRLALHLGGDVKSHLGLALSRTNHLYSLCVGENSSPQQIRNALEALRLGKEMVMEHAKWNLIQKGSEHNGNTYEHNPLLAQLIKSASTTGGDANGN